MSTPPKKKKKSLKKLTHELDHVFSEYTRRRSADWKGIAKCVSCGVQKPWQELQCGHYVKRSARATRWLPANCFPQCCACNVFKNGNYADFTNYLLENFGANYIKDLVRQGHTIKKWTTVELANEITKYQDLNSKL